MTDRDPPSLDKICQLKELVLLQTRFGDLTVLLGSLIHHVPVNPAEAAILYIKLGGAGSNPLVQDIYHAT